jgi:hypothetical protein
MLSMRPLWEARKATLLWLIKNVLVTLIAFVVVAGGWMIALSIALHLGVVTNSILLCAFMAWGTLKMIAALWRSWANA